MFASLKSIQQQFIQETFSKTFSRSNFSKIERLTTDKIIQALYYKEN